MAALVIASTGTGPDRTAPAPGTGGADAASARTVLLAAEKAETAPATGKYWRVTTMDKVPVKVGPRTRPHTVEDTRITEEWTARYGEQAWVGRRTAGAKPKTPQDAKAWRLDGSPTRWNLGVGDTADQRPVYVQVKPSAGTPVKAAGPVTLRALAEKHALADGRGGPLRADNEQVRQGFAVSRLIGLLTTATVPPSVRAAAFRAPAGMPVVRSEGPVADGLGRRGRRSRSTPRTRAGRTAAG